MSITEGIERLRKEAAELVERAARRGRPLSAAEDAKIVTLLKEAQELELRDKQDKQKHRLT